MATKPTKLPQWAALADGSDNDIVDGVSGKNNVAEPTLGQKESGWLFKQFPPRQILNWLARLTFQWLKYVDDSIDQELNTTSSPTFAGLTVNGGNLTVAAGDELNVIGDGYISVLESTDVESAIYRVLDGSLTEQGTISHDSGSNELRILTGSDSIKMEAGGSGSLFLRSAAGGSSLLFGSTNLFLLASTGTMQFSNGAGDYEILNLPTSAPAGSNKMWNDGGTLKITP